MVTRLTKIQLIIFAFITVIGAAFVGGRYAQIDRYFVDRTYTVTMDLERSGSIFTNAEVTYRGVGVGRVGAVSFTEEGVEVELRIENDAPDIPADTEALVANKSAVGEQFVDLRPRSAGGPYLSDGDRIAQQNTAVPIETHEMVIHVADLLASVDADNLNTVVSELGTAFEDTGDDLSRITRTTTEFIDTASQNLDLTRELIRTSNSVLQTQIDSGSSIQAFSRDLRLFTDTLVEADGDLRTLVDEGPAAAAVLEQTIAENHDQLTQVLNDLRIATYPLSVNHLGLRGMMALFPLIVEGGYVVPALNDHGEYDARFGLTLPLAVEDGVPEYREVPRCQEGYPQRDRGYRSPHDRTERPFDVTADCRDENYEDLVPRTPRRTTVDGRPGRDIPPMPRAVVAGTAWHSAYDGAELAGQDEEWWAWESSATATRP